MSNQLTSTRSQACFAPEINKLITAYCFGHISEQEQADLEAHLLECDVCWREVQKLEAAVQALSRNRTLTKSMSGADLASVLGISARWAYRFAGHGLHVLVVCLMLGLMYAIELLVEVAYQFNQYRQSAWPVAGFIGIFIFISSVSALALDWKLTAKGKAYSLATSLLTFLISAITLFIGLRFYLPAYPITEANFQTYTAQGAYLKEIIYFLILTVLYLAIPFHFILALQQEVKEGRYRLVLRLLTGNKMSVSPKGALYLQFWVLATILGLFLGITLYHHTHLFDNLKPSVHMNLFMQLMYVRVALYFVIAIEGLAWYYKSLNEIKRDCLAMSHTR